MQIAQRSHVVRGDFAHADSVAAERGDLVEEVLVLPLETADGAVDSSQVLVDQLLSLLLQLVLQCVLVVEILPLNRFLFLRVDLGALCRERLLDVASHGATDARTRLLLPDALDFALRAYHEGFP